MEILLLVSIYGMYHKVALCDLLQKYRYIHEQSLFLPVMSNKQQKKYRPLQKMFMEVPGKYDLLNRTLTWRFDEAWRRGAVKEIIRDNPQKILDLCTGTGDLLLRIADRSNGHVQLIGLDYSPPMLEIARKKAEKKKAGNTEFIHGDAADMPFSDGHFDAIGIAFAFRNLTYKNPDRDKFLKEIHRVTSPGGKFVIIETSRPRSALIQHAVNLYMNLAVKTLGGALSGHKSAYRYLAESAKHYYSADEVTELLSDAGFSSVKYKLFFGGVAALHVAVR